MTLRMFGYMDDQAADGGRQLLTPHIARLFIGLGIDAPHQSLGCDELGVHRGEQLGERRAGCALGLEARQLIGGELFATQIGRQAVHATRDMREMKAERRDGFELLPDVRYAE